MTGTTPEWVFLRPAAPPHRGGQSRLVPWLQSVLEHLNWRASIVVLPDRAAPVPEGWQSLVQVVTEHLDRYRFATVTLRPVVHLPGGDERTLFQWPELLSAMRPFQEEAYHERSESRLLVHPVVVAAPAASEVEVLTAARFFRSRLATPVVVLWREPGTELVAEARAERLRLIVAGNDEGNTGQILTELGTHHVFDTLLDRIADAGADGTAEDLLKPCRSHLVADGEYGVFGCLAAWQRRDGAAPLEPEQLPECGCRPAECARCYAGAAGSVLSSLRANGRQESGREACFQLGLALSRQGEHRLAAASARRAFELAADDRRRVAALLHEGLCHLACGELPRADEVLCQARTCGADPGLVAFHRGRVQAAWRDDIEALEHYEEALRLGSAEVAASDLRFEMALSHIKLEEYHEAGPHLDAAIQEGREAPVWFYRGVCALNLKGAENALPLFERALSCSPAAEDLGRVLLLIGTCHKELERYEEAIEVLQQAVAADPDDLANHNLLGYCYFRTDRFAEAVECFRRAVAIDPTSAIDWANLGSNLRRLGRLEEAAAMYTKALSLDPTIGFARDHLARLRQVIAPQ